MINVMKCMLERVCVVYWYSFSNPRTEVTCARVLEMIDMMKYVLRCPALL